MNFRVNRFIACFLASIFTVSFVLGQNVLPPEPSTEITPEMLQRFERLEAETQQLREEVARLNADKIRVTSAEPPAEAASPQETMTREEIDEYIERHIKDNAWKVGKMKLTPYVIVWASVLCTDRKTANSDWIGRPLPGDQYDRTVTSIQARTSRLGMKIAAPDVCFMGCMMKSHGLVEIDFANSCNSENKGTIQLREAYWALENDDYKILFGQTKDIISPLIPRFRDYNALFGNGHLGYRNPMLSFTRYYHLSENVRMDWATALVQVCGMDQTAYDQIGSYPTLQSRIGWTIARDCCKYPIKFGIGAHIGEVRYDFPSESDRITSWSVNADLELPVTDRFGFRAEFFHGQGLAGHAGGCYQSIDYDVSKGIGTRNSIHTTGGWAEFWWDWTDQLHWAAGYSIDDPHDEDIEGAKVLNNRVIYVNVMYDFTKFLSSGLLYTHHMVDYRPGVYSEDFACANGIEWFWKLTF